MIVKNSMMHIFKDPYILAYLVFYLIVLLLLHSLEGMSILEPLVALLVAGVGFSTVAWWTTRGTVPFPYLVKQPKSECILLVLCLVVVTLFLTWGLNIVETAIHTEPLKSLAILAAKLLMFVLLPLLLWRAVWRYPVRDLMNIGPGTRRHLRIIGWMALVLILFQIILGRGLSVMRESGLPWWSLVVGAPFAYVWLVLEAGLVEEFFFRALIQSRLAALLKSETAGVVLMSILFGLAHAPGMYLRTSKSLEILGPSPSLLAAVGYSILITSVAGFFLGVLWARTKNLTVVVLVHAAADLVPSITGIVQAWTF